MPEGWLSGGDEAQVLNCGHWVLHLSPSWRTPEELSWCHQVAQQVKQHIPEAVAPLHPHHGDDSFFLWRGYRVTVFPRVVGTHLNSTVSPLRQQAATLLSALHRLDSQSFTPRPVNIQAPRPVKDIPDTFQDPELDKQWQQALESGLSTGLCHGDYYQANLLCHEQKLVGIIDWHEAHVGTFLLELAGACFEMCHLPDGELDPQRARDFVAAYRLQSPISSREYALLPLALRVWLRQDALNCMAWGDLFTCDYVQQHVRAFHRLRNFSPGSI